MSTTQQRLISELRSRFEGESEAAIARHAGLSPQRWNNYTQGHTRMDDDAVLGCAAALGIDPKKTLAKHRAELAKTPRERAFWMRVASAACLALGVWLPHPSPAATQGAGHAQSIHYANIRERLRRWFRWQHAT